MARRKHTSEIFRHNSEGGDDLARLRKEKNTLVRELADMRLIHEKALQSREDRANTLSRELDLIRGSRVWRLANALRRFDPRIVVRKGSGNRSRSKKPGWPRDHRAFQYRQVILKQSYEERLGEDFQRQLALLNAKPLISIALPVHDAQPDILEKTLRSVYEQVYDNWELCIVDDGSTDERIQRMLSDIDDVKVKTKRLDRNMGIAAATNQAIDMAGGDYIAFLDHDDMLSRTALLEVAKVINSDDADFVYTDEDYMDEEDTRVYPHFKPDFSPDLLLSHNYITHLVVVSRALATKVGGLRGNFDGAQDYDFVLRATEQACCIRHIPRVLYHWRTGASSTATNPESKPESGRRALQAVEEALRRRNIPFDEVVEGNVPNFHAVRFTISGKPRVSIIIPFKDKADYLHCVVGDILEKSSYENYEILGINNQSAEEETSQAMMDLEGLDERIRFIDYDDVFNFAAIANFGVDNSTGDHIVLLNNDIRIISPAWIEKMLEYSQRFDTGAVGGKLYFPDGRVQHAGIIVGIGGYAGHSHKGFPGTHQGYFNRLQVVQNVSAVTGAFMMVKRELYRNLGGFDQESFSVACNDVDFCLRLREKGYWNVFTPYAEAYHVESASRGYEDTPEKTARFEQERRRFSERHTRILEQGDPFYNPNLTRSAEDFSLKEAS